jgi:hypothetical protein
MSFGTEIAEALAEVELVLAKSLTWNSTTYACSPSGLSSQDGLGSGGFAPEAAISFSIRKSLFSSAIPAVGQSVVFETKTYKITEVVTDAAGATVRLVCADPNG